MRLALSGGCLLALLACAGSVPVPRWGAVEGAVADENAEATAGTQSLFRLSYDGGDGRVPLRVVLRERSGGRFQVVASDVAGRTVWGLDSSLRGTILVDHRERRYCRTGPGFRLTDLHPEELPLAALPRVLGGRLPVEPPDGALAGEWTDASGSVWSATQDEEGPLTWTLYREGEPVVWWSRRPDGGILSRRGGEQYRWTLVAHEPSSGALPDPVPAGFEEGVCSD